MRTKVEIAAVAVVAVVAVASCSSAAHSSAGAGATGASGAAPARSSPSTTTPPADISYSIVPAPTKIEKPPGPTLAMHRLGRPAFVSDEVNGGVFNFTVLRISGVVKPNGNPNYTIGAIVKISNVDGNPEFITSQIGTFPRKNASLADDGSNDGGLPETTAWNKQACAGTKMLRQVLAEQGIRRRDYLDYRLHYTGRPIVGCLTFTYDRRSIPTAIARYGGTQSVTPSGHELDQWNIRTPSKIQHANTDIILTVTGNGSSALVTYGIGTSISQDTGAAIPWTRKVGPNSDFYSLSAQDNDGSLITCTIKSPTGQVLDRQTSHGAYAIASCSTSS